MSFRGSISTPNAAPLLQRFTALSSVEMGKVLGAALRKAGVRVRTETRSVAPTENIKARVNIGRVTKRASDTSPIGTHAVVVYAGHKANKDTYYYGFLEHGTRPRFHKSGKSVGSVAPRHFMREAFERSVAEASAIMEQEIAAGIDRLAKA